MMRWSFLRAPALPAAAPLPAALDTALTVALAMFGFLLPFSVAGVALMMGALLLLAVLGAPAVWRSAPWRDPVAAVGLILLAYIGLHTALTTGFIPRAISGVNRYHELFVGVVLLGLFRVARRPQVFLYALAAGSVFYALAHWLALGIPALDTYLKPRYISAGFVLAVTAFVLFDQSQHHVRWRLPMRLAALFLALTVLFTIEGRTGHVVLVLLVAYAVWCWGPRRLRWTATFALPTLVISVSMAFGAVQSRVAETLTGLRGEQSSQIGSTAIRVELLRTGLTLAGEYYLSGAGYGRYVEVHEKAVQARDEATGRPPAAVENRPWASAANPHNEYIMQLVSGGLVSLGLFLAWLVLPALRLRRGEFSPSLVAASAAFAIGCLFNSLLMDFVEGHFYMGLLAWLLAQSTRPPPPIAAAAPT